MAGYFRAPSRTFRTGAAIGQHLRVKVGSDATITVAAANDSDVGTTARETFASGEEVAVELASLEGTAKMVAAGVVAIGAKVYGAAAGKVSTTSSSAQPVGIALSAAAADGDVIEVLRRQS